MSRDYAKINVTIWQDSDFRALPFPAQHLYTTMWAHPELSYCGVLDWRPGRLAALAGGWTAQAVRVFGDCLAARHFIVVDDETEEALVRSWVRWEEVLKQPRLSVSYVKAFAAVASNDIRRVLVHELAKVREHTPDLAGFTDQRVLSVLTSPSVSAKDLPVPTDPFAQGLPTGLGTALGIALGQGLAQTRDGVCLPPTTAPATAPLHQEKIGSQKQRATQIPDDFQPSDANVKYAADNGIDLRHEMEQFRNHHVAKGTTFKNWNAGLRTWLGNATKWSQPQRRPEAVPSYKPEPAPDPDSLPWGEAS